MGTFRPAGAVLLLSILCCNVVGSSTRMAFLGAPLHPVNGVIAVPTQSSTGISPVVMMARPETKALKGKKGRSGSLEIAPNFYIKKPSRYLNSTEELVLIKATKRLKVRHWHRDLYTKAEDTTIRDDVRDDAFERCILH
jgi:hypothetical protein